MSMSLELIFRVSGVATGGVFVRNNATVGFTSISFLPGKRWSSTTRSAAAIEAPRHAVRREDRSAACAQPMKWPSGSLTSLPRHAVHAGLPILSILTGHRPGRGPHE